MHKAGSPRIFYGWIVLAVAFLLTTTSGAILFTYGIFLGPLEAEFGWSRGMTGSVLSFYLITYGISGTVAGRFADRFGPRLPVALAAPLIGVGLALCSKIDSLAYLCLLYAVAGLGAGVLWSIPLSVVQKWFLRGRGLVLGVTVSGIGVGGLVFVPAADHLIAAYGWRPTFIMLGVLCGALVGLAAWLIADSPAKMGFRPHGAALSTVRGEDGLAQDQAPVDQEAEIPAWTLREAARTKAFYGLCALNFLSVLPVTLITVHLVPFAVDRGIQGAAGALGLLGGLSVAGRIVMGGAAERLGWQRGFFICVGMSGIMLFWLMASGSRWMLYLFVVLYGYFYGGKVPYLPGLTGLFFGTRSLAEVLGILNIFALAAMAIGPAFAGFVFDSTGSYFVPLLVAAVSYGLSGLLVLVLKPPRKEVLGATGAAARA